MKKERVKKAAIVIISLTIFSIAYYIFYKITGIGIPCMFHTFLGWYCSGCGITRMIFSFMQLDFYQAFRYNAYLCVLTPFGIFMSIDWLIGYLYDRPTKFFSKVPNAVWIIILVGAILFGVIRNIEPFTYLAPTDIREVRE